MALVLLQHRVAEDAAVVAGTRERHVDRDGRDPLPPLPGADPVLVPVHLRSVEDELRLLGGRAGGTVGDVTDAHPPPRSFVALRPATQSSTRARPVSSPCG